MKFNVAFLLFLVYVQVASTMIPTFVYKGVSAVIHQILGEDIKLAAMKFHQKMDKSLGKDISIGDISTMDVEMVRLVEPFPKHAIVTDFISNKAANNMGFLKPLKHAIMKDKVFDTKYDEIQTDYNEVIGIYIVLNESETAAAEVLLSAQPCLISSSDHYFSRIRDPCKFLAKDGVSKILGRFDGIDKMRTVLGKYLKTPSEWDHHWRQIYYRLDPYINDIGLSKSERASWDKIKDLISSARVV
jgi:hypothetical protein